jgi:hypothetical protein
MHLFLGNDPIIFSWETILSKVGDSQEISHGMEDIPIGQGMEEIPILQSVTLRN